MIEYKRTVICDGCGKSEWTSVTELDVHDHFPPIPGGWLAPIPGMRLGDVRLCSRECLATWRAKSIAQQVARIEESIAKAFPEPAT